MLSTKNNNLWSLKIPILVAVESTCACSDCLPARHEHWLRHYGPADVLTMAEVDPVKATSFKRLICKDAADFALRDIRIRFFVSNSCRAYQQITYLVIAPGVYNCTYFWLPVIIISVPL